MILIISAWWILATVSGVSGRDGDIPRAIGPYPSEEICMIAGNKLMPSDSRFQTDSQKEEIRRAAEAREEECNQLFGAVPASKKKGWVSLPGCGARHFGPPVNDGAVLSDISSGWTVIDAHSYSAITSCTEVKQ